MTGVEIAIGLAVASAAVSAVGAITQGNAARAAGNREAAAFERNKNLANQDRIRDIETSRIAADDKRREQRRQLASVRAAYGTSGIELAGSPLDVLADTSTEMALDVRRIEDEGAVANRSGALKMLGLQESADTSRAEGINKRKSSVIQAGAGLLQSGSSIASMGSQAGGPWDSTTAGGK